MDAQLLYHVLLALREEVPPSSYLCYEFTLEISTIPNIIQLIAIVLMKELLHRLAQVGRVLRGSH